MKHYRKYNNRETVINNIKFDSKKEAKYYIELNNKKKAGLIKKFELQKKYVLIPSQKGFDGKVLERPLTYRADFVVTENDGNVFIYDVKGYKTDIYKIKKKLMLYFHNIRIIEI
jgi:hypothetical protein